MIKTHVETDPKYNPVNNEVIENDTSSKEFETDNFENNEDLSNIRLTVDQEEDLELIQNLYSIFSPKDDFGLHEIKDLLLKNPTLFRINSKYQRNEGHLQSLKEDEIE